MREYFKDLFGKPAGFSFFSTGFLARYGICRGLINSRDHLVFDEGIHASMIDGIYASRTKGVVSKIKHTDVAAMEASVKEIREKSPNNLIMVIYADYYPNTGQWADLEAIDKILVKYDAYAIIDTTETVFVTGDKGLTRMTTFDLDMERYFVLGSGSKSLGLNFGFVTAPGSIFEQFLKYFTPSLTFSNAIPPVTAAMALYNVKLIEGADGDNRRQAVRRNSEFLYDQLKAAGFELVNTRGMHIVTVLIGSRLLARAVVNLITQEGVTTVYSEYPEVDEDQSLIKFNVQPFHSSQQLKLAVTALVAALDKARNYLENDKEGIEAVSALQQVTQKL